MGDEHRMTATRISIVTPSFNQAPFVEQTIKSIIGQDYPNLEYVVIDGGSTDGSDDIISRYRSYLHHYVSEPDAGHADALNKGFRHTTGEIMAWLNSDDMYLPGTFRTVAELFDQNPDIHWLVGTKGFFNDRGTLMFTKKVNKNLADFLSGHYGWIQQESVFWRRSLWERAGGHVDETYKFMVDGELWCRFFTLEKLWHVNCVLSGYRIHKRNRGVVYRKECEEEMKRAIGDLRRHADATRLSATETGYPTLRYDFAKSAWTRVVVPRISARPQTSPGLLR